MGGLLIAEIQQNSNTTYRVYDWGRVGADGKPRPLHIEKAMDVINFDQVEPTICPSTFITKQDGVRRLELCRNQYFVTERVEMQAGLSYSGVCDGRTLEIWGVIAGRGQIGDVELNAVQFVLLPAALGAFTVRARGNSILLRTYVS